MALPLLLLTVALGVKSAHCLECYVCNVTMYSGCENIRNCSETQVFCTRYTATTTSGFILRLACAEHCPIARQTWPKLYTLTCCQENQCNSAVVRRYNPALTMVLLLRVISTSLLW